MFTEFYFVIFYALQFLRSANFQIFFVCFNVFFCPYVLYFIKHFLNYISEVIAYYKKKSGRYDDITDDQNILYS